ncbi:epoxide hydrolase N-terminal domain-containing protein, partial [Xanthomonas maliensis]|uniref:epoxide hydrolase N-terminal domain-containing protein n=1 Tax=Xanthomonas maliensis TaxID=1321368 RepID=UPI00056DCA5D
MITPFPIHVAQSLLDDLQQRLRQTRWPSAETVSDQSQGPQSERIRRLVERWQTGYDWRATEQLVNGWNSSRTAIDGLDIHFLHVRSPEPGALPLLLTHGWPGSFLEFRQVIGALSDPVAHGGKASDAF